jgi:hypothetical protein
MRRSVQLLRILAISAAFLVVGVLHHPGGALAQPTTSPRIQQTDLVYQGAFRLPSGTFGGSSFAYGGTAPAYNPTNHSLFLVGHDWDQQVAEVAIPQIINSAQLSSLATASMLQPFTDASEGKMSTVDTGTIKVGGLMVYGGKLYGTAYSYYDGDGSQVLSHYVRPLNLSVRGAVQGMYQLGSLGAGFVSGYMTQIPPEWQSAFGGPALTGQCCIPITSRTSYGPPAFVFAPADLGVKNPVPLTPLVYYPQSHPNIGNWDGNWDPSRGLYYNGNTIITGIVFPSGSRSVLFFGTQGTAAFCYGGGTSDPSLAGRPSSDGGAYCYDLDYSAKGTHGYPYVLEVWAYDATDLLAVKNGQKQPWDVKPYATWSLNLPFGSTTIGGATYDPQTGRIFLSQQRADIVGYDPLPVIHVFTVKHSTPSASLLPPTNLRVQ